MISIVSWNVLYRSYEETFNQNSLVLSKYPIETDRINDIKNIITSMSNSSTLICLQEASLDLINVLMKEDKITELYETFTFHVRNSEYLVTLCPKGHNFSVEENTEHPEIANGILSVSNKYFRFVNCHFIPQEYTKGNVMCWLYDKFDNDKVTFVAGDFNESYDKICKKLSSKYTAFYFGKTYKNRCIDNIIVDNTHVNNFSFQTFILKSHYMSDHNLVKLNCYINTESQLNE